jgi:hypothetical protein
MSLVYTSFSRLAQASITRRGIANRAPPREVQTPKSENHSDPRRFLYRANRTVGKGNFREVVRKELARQFARDQGMKVSTANNSLRVLRRILNLAVEWACSKARQNQNTSGRKPPRARRFACALQIWSGRAKSLLFDAIQKEIHRHDFSYFVDEPQSVAQGGKGVGVGSKPLSFPIFRWSGK